MFREALVLYPEGQSASLRCVLWAKCRVTEHKWHVMTTMSQETDVESSWRDQYLWDPGFELCTFTVQMRKCRVCGPALATQESAGRGAPVVWLRQNTRKWRDPTCWSVYLPTKHGETFSKCVRAIESSQWCIAKKITYARAERRVDLSQVIVQAMQLVRLDSPSLRIFAIQRSTNVAVIMGRSTIVHELHARSCV